MKKKASVMAFIMAASLCLTNLSPMIALADEQTAVSESEEAAEQEKNSGPDDSDKSSLNDSKGEGSASEESEEEISQGEEDNNDGSDSEISNETDVESGKSNEENVIYDSDDTDAGSADAVTDDDTSDYIDTSDDDDAADDGDVTDQGTSDENDTADNGAEGSNEIGSENNTVDDTADEEVTAEKGSAASDGRIRVASVEPEEQNVVPGDLSGMSTDELFAMYVEDAFDLQGDGGSSNGRRSQASKLSGNNLKIYNKIASILPLVAAGERGSAIFEISVEDLGLKEAYSAEELNVASVFVLDENGEIYEDENGNCFLNEDACDAMSALADNDLSLIIDVLLADHPYELYWYDKTEGTDYLGFGYSSLYDYETDEYKLAFRDNMEFCFHVSSDYSAGEYQVDQSIGQSVQTSVTNAAGIVSDHESQGDVEKLTAYKDEICEWVSYNDAAADKNNNTPYGDPWQLIWVFDGDPATKVVCEGYSKAFKYLCDQSTFVGDVDCILVTGYMGGGTGAGPHMWNVVSMPDLENYLVDVTNCDSGSVGAPDQLFLVGYGERSSGEGRQTSYTIITDDNERVDYEYDEDTLSLFDASETDLNSSNYDPSATHVHNLTHNEAVAATCTTVGKIEYWYCDRCGKYFSDEVCENEITQAETVVPAGHTAERTAAAEATCTTNGNIEYWYCSKCEKYFSDEACENEITQAQTIVPAGHTAERTAAVEATCTTSGNIEYWYCDKCGKYFSDEACESEITLSETVINATGHVDPLEHTEAKEATCTTDGNIEYWQCSKCEKYFSDEACEHEITQAQTVTRAVPHKWSGWTVTKAATYDAAGSKERECENCHTKQTESIAKLPRTPLNQSMISGVGNKTFTGSAISQSPVVKNGNTVLTAGKDYTVDNGNYVNAGTAYVTVTGKGAYSGTVKIPYTIAPMSIKSAVVTGIANKTYTGKALKPVPVVKLGTKTLSAGRDYKVTYASNKKVGKATVTITGAGNYTDTVSKTFVINPKKTRIKKVTSLTQGFTVKWVKQSAQTTGYQIQYSTNKNFKSGKKTVTISKAKTVSKQITGLEEKTTYYVRIRTFKKAGKKYYSAWSAVKKVTTK